MRRSIHFASAVLALLLLLIVPLHAQQPSRSTIRGRITDSTTQQPLVGATVTVAGRGVLTQPDGRYAIAGVSAGAQTPRVRMIGYGRSSTEATAADGHGPSAAFSTSRQAVTLAEVVVAGVRVQP